MQSTRLGLLDTEESDLGIIAGGIGDISDHLLLGGRNVLIEAEQIRGIVLRFNRRKALEARVTVSRMHVVPLGHVVIMV